MVVSNLFFSLMEIRRANYEQSVILSEYLEEDLVFDTIFVKVIVPLKNNSIYEAHLLNFLDSMI